MSTPTTPVFISYSAASTGAAGTLTTTAPSSVAVGDLLILAVLTQSTGTQIAPAAGWSAVMQISHGATGNALKGGLYTHIYTGSEAGSFWQMTVPDATIGNILCYRDVDATVPLATPTRGINMDVNLSTGVRNLTFTDTTNPIVPRNRALAIAFAYISSTTSTPTLGSGTINSYGGSYTSRFATTGVGCGFYWWDGKGNVTTDGPLNIAGPSNASGWSGTASDESGTYQAILIPSGVQSTTKSPSSSAGTAAGGTLDWSNKANIYVDDNSRALVSYNPSVAVQTYWLDATNYSFGLSTGASVIGVLVDSYQRHYAYGNSNAGSSVQLDYRLVPSSAAKSAAYNVTPVVNTSPTSSSPADTNYSAGSLSDLWGLSNLTAADVSDSNFGVSVRAIVAGVSTNTAQNSEVDWMPITVYYLPPESAGAGPLQFVEA